MSERWREIDGCPGYEVSDLGRVKNTRRGWFLSGCRGPRGYWLVSLKEPGRKNPRSHPMHRIVMLAFAGPRPPGHDIDHVNGIKSDNRLANLEYVTRRENMRRAFATGLILTGEEHHSAKLTDQEVRFVRDCHAAGALQKDLAADFGVCRQTIGRIFQGIEWSHVT